MDRKRPHTLEDLEDALGRIVEHLEAVKRLVNHLPKQRGPEISAYLQLHEYDRELEEQLALCREFQQPGWYEAECQTIYAQHVDDCKRRGEIPEPYEQFKADSEAHSRSLLPSVASTSVTLARLRGLEQRLNALERA